jgi:hypothetical protein
MMSNVASTAYAASVLVMRDVSATALIKSFLVIGPIPLLDLHESPALAGDGAKFPSHEAKTSQTSGKPAPLKGLRVTGRERNAHRPHPAQAQKQG